MRRDVRYWHKWRPPTGGAKAIYLAASPERIVNSLAPARNLVRGQSSASHDAGATTAALDLK